MSPICAARAQASEPAVGMELGRRSLQRPSRGGDVLAIPLMECHQASVGVPGSARTKFLEKGSLASGLNEMCDFSSFYIFILPKKTSTSYNITLFF